MRQPESTRMQCFKKPRSHNFSPLLALSSPSLLFSFLFIKSKRISNNSLAPRRKMQRMGAAACNWRYAHHFFVGMHVHAAAEEIPWNFSENKLCWTATNLFFASKTWTEKAYKGVHVYSKSYETHLIFLLLIRWSEKAYEGELNFSDILDHNLSFVFRPRAHKRWLLVYLVTHH